MYVYIYVYMCMYTYIPATLPTIVFGLEPVAQFECCVSHGYPLHPCKSSQQPHTQLSQTPRAWTCNPSRVHILITFENALSGHPQSLPRISAWSSRHPHSIFKHADNKCNMIRTYPTKHAVLSWSGESRLWLSYFWDVLKLVGDVRDSFADSSSWWGASWICGIKSSTRHSPVWRATKRKKLAPPTPVYCKIVRKNTDDRFWKWVCQEFRTSPFNFTTCRR